MPNKNEQLSPVGDVGSEFMVGGLKITSLWHGSARYKIGAMLGFPVRFEPHPEDPYVSELVFIRQNDSGHLLMDILVEADTHTLSQVARDIENGRYEYIESLLVGDEKGFYERDESTSEKIRNRDSLPREFLERCYMAAFEQLREREGEGIQIPLRFADLFGRGQTSIDMEGLMGEYLKLFRSIMFDFVRQA